MLLKLMLFIYYYKKTQQVYVARGAISAVLKVLFFMLSLDLKIFLIPFLLQNWKNIVKEAIYLKILSAVSISLQIAGLIVDLLLNHDFKYTKTNLN
jgi:hypothetical protein